jgi:GDSL-like Lipase/Acylhydrolase family
MANSLTLACRLAWCLCAMALGLPLQARTLPFQGDADPERFECPATVAPRPPSPAGAPPPPVAPLNAEEVGRLQQAAGPVIDLSFEPRPPLWPAARPGQALRVALWGDSHSAARFLSEGLTEGLAGPGQVWRAGFLPAALGMSGVRLPVRKTCLGGAWSRSFAHRAGAGSAPFGRGLLRLASQESGSFAWLDLRTGGSPQGLQALDLVFSRPPAGADAEAVIALSVNDSPEELVTIDPGQDRVLGLQAAHGVMTVRLRLISGQVSIDGFELQHRQLPEMVLDTFGIPGATARGWARLDPALWTAPPDRGDYDVVLMAYGTNEGADTEYQPSRYETGLLAAVGRLREVYPQALCVLIGPTDRGVVRRRGADAHRRMDRAEVERLLRHARVHRSITEVQQRVGQSLGCHAWDWQSAMGGLGGAYRWFLHSPRLMAPDLIHLTPEGYRVSGRALAARLLGQGVGGRPASGATPAP